MFCSSGLRWLLLSLLISQSLQTVADNLVIGKTYPIKEPDLLQGIEKELASKQGTLKEIKKEIQKKTNAYIRRPPVSKTIARTTEPATRYYDPSITVPYDIRDATGVIIHPAGTTINPLDFVSMTSRLVFFDGDDVEQVAWVKKLLVRDKRVNKLILTNGSPTALMQALERRVAFDQASRITTQLGILRVPAIVYQEQEAKELTIDELVP
jgi:conjugal transfer pilus assembly protein TraW